MNQQERDVSEHFTNQQIRDGLRELHRRVDYRDGADFPKCGFCNNGFYPCHVIQVLDAWEASLAENTTKCDHLWLTKAGTSYRFKFVEVCAKCGEER